MKLANLGGLVLIALVAVFITYRFNAAQETINGVPREEIARTVVLKAFDAITVQADKGELIMDVECYGSTTTKIDCKGVGSTVHTASFSTAKPMPELRVKGQRGLDGQLHLVTLTGVPDKLKSTEVIELFDMFGKPVKL